MVYAPIEILVKMGAALNHMKILSDDPQTSQVFLEYWCTTFDKEAKRFEKLLFFLEHPIEDTMFLNVGILSM